MSNYGLGDRKLRKLDMYCMIPVSPVSAVVHEPAKLGAPRFLVANKYGVYEIILENDKICQNHLEDIIRDLEVKYLQHDRGDAFLIFPKWDKYIKRIALSNTAGRYARGATTLRDVEWTKGSVALTGFNPDRADWHIGFSGKSLFLSEFLIERSYVLATDIDFNYWCDI